MDCCPRCRNTPAPSGNESCTRCSMLAISGEYWTGGDITGPLLVIAPNSYGDCFERARHLPILTECGITWRLVLPAELIELFSQVFPKENLVSYGDPLPEYTQWVDLLDGLNLALAIGERPPEIEFKPTPLVAKKYSILPRPSIGFCYEAAEKYEGTRMRSLRAQDAEQVVRILDNVTWISLQYQKSLSNTVDTKFSNWTEAAGIIANVDAVVSVDSAVAHLAMSMGKLTILLYGTASTSQVSYPDYTQQYSGPIKQFKPIYGGSEAAHGFERFIKWTKTTPEWWKFNKA